MKRPSTKEAIVETAIELFNAKGTTAVSTNHIASAMGISPGNLYYHFQNKEEIIRTIYQRMVSQMDTAWAKPDVDTPSLDTLFSAMTAIQTMLVDYRFFQRELSVLLFNDPELAAINKAVRASRQQEIEAFFEHLINIGVMRRPEDKKTLPRLIRIGWLIGDYWLDYLSIENAPLDEHNVSEGIDLIRETLRPYLLAPA